MDWKKARQERDMARRVSEASEPREERTPGPQTHIKRAPVKHWKDMTHEERRRIEEALGLSPMRKGGKHRQSPL